jgi:hypothetical protein
MKKTNILTPLKIFTDIIQDREIIRKKINSILKRKHGDFDDVVNKLFKWLEKTKGVKINYQGIVQVIDSEDNFYAAYQIEINKGKYRATCNVDKDMMDYCKPDNRGLCTPYKKLLEVLGCEVIQRVNAVLEAKKQRLVVS